MLLSFATKQAQKSPYSAVTIGALVYGGERGIDKYQAEACYLVLRTAFGAQNATHLVMVIKLKLAKKSAGPPSAPKMQRILSKPARDLTLLSPAKKIPRICDAGD